MCTVCLRCGVFVCRDGSSFEASLLDRDTAMRAVAEWSAIGNAAQAASDMAATRVGECGAPEGCRDTADWLARTAGTSHAKAKERVRTGERLRTQERTRAKATAGE